MNTLHSEKNHQAEMEKLEQALQRTAQNMNHLVHDIRTPMTGILAMAEDILAANKKVDQLTQTIKQTELQHYIEIINKDTQLLIQSAEHIMHFCNEMLDMARLEDKTATVKHSIFSFSKLIKEIRSLLNPAFVNTPITLTCVLKEAVPPYLSGQVSYIKRILLNLVSNALKFTEEGSVKLTVALAEPSNPKPGDVIHLQCIVEDTGMGIPADKLEAIFEPFVRLKTATLIKGSGLGLPAVKSYVRFLKGHLKVQSTLEKGSCFTVTLPLKVAEAPKPLDKTDPEQVLKQLRQQCLRILLVEDDPLAALGAQQALKVFQAEVDVADNGKTAIEQANENDYDLVLLDLGLPDVDGLEVIRVIRTMIQSPRAQVPIIVLTGHAGNPAYDKPCLEMGAQAILSKPARQNDLLRVLQQHVLRETLV